MFILTSVILSALLSIHLLGCERIHQVVQPDATTTATETTLKIGVIQPSNTFTTFSQGAETARAQINQGGGVLGMQVEFLSRNNQPIATEPPTPEASVSAAKELIEIEDVFALLGPIYSTNSVEVGPIAQQTQRLMLPGSSGANVPAAGDYVFLITVPNPFQGKVMAGFAMNPDELGATTAATIYETDDVIPLISPRHLRHLFRKSVVKSSIAVPILSVLRRLLNSSQKSKRFLLTLSSVPVFNQRSPY
jgi:hypothetical protein